MNACDTSDQIRVPFRTQFLSCSKTASHCGLWIATNCFNGFNRRNGNLKFVENGGVLGFAAMLQFVWIGLVS